MPTTPDQKDYIVTQLERVFEAVRVRPMMGEYLVYVNEVYCANICDGNLLLKITPTNSSYDLPKVLPYASAKRNMLKVTRLDDFDFLREVVEATLAGLPQKSSHAKSKKSK